jgi:hypothetical protein
MGKSEVGENGLSTAIEGFKGSEKRQNLRNRLSIGDKVEIDMV